MSALRRQVIPLFMIVEAVLLSIAASVHGGLLVAGYAHREAYIAESVLAAVLLAGLLLIGLRRSWTRAVGVAAQAFALLGTLVGVFTMIVGVGPQTTPDIIYHAALLVLLLVGVFVAARAERPLAAGSGA